jgi:hypothetical protein
MSDTMNAHDSKTEIGRHGLAIAVWENEGGAPDRSWSIYHVFTGVPADIGGHAMTGPSRSNATEGMRSLNRRNERRRHARRAPMAAGPRTLEIDEVRS